MMTKPQDATMLRQWAVETARSGAADNAEARANLRRMMDKDEAVYRAVTRPEVDRAITRAIAEFSCAHRDEVWRRPTAADDRVAALARANSETLYDLLCRDGTPLGDATREKVLASAQDWGQRAKTLGAKARFMTMVAERLPEGATVRDALTLEALEEMRREAGD